MATSAASRERSRKMVDAFMTATKGARKVTPPLASATLAAVRFAPDEEKRDTPRKPTLRESFEARSAELGRIMAPGPSGKVTVRPEVRRQIADRLSGLAAAAPHVADRAETLAVRRLEFIESKRPRAIRIGMTTIPPSEMAVRAWARYIAAAEGPDGIEERLADGTITPEDAETMRELYPERMAAITRQVVERMAELRATLTHQQRLRLSLFTGQPVDAALEPRIFARLQGAHRTEPGTEGGTQAPVPQPAFASVKKPEPTPAQSRAG